jgi:protein-S-isoprenylcysteine O-methyltransferase Ste14
MSSDRIQRVGDRSGLMGWWDRLRYNEILRQGIGLLLVAVCAYFARPGSTLVIIGLVMAAFGQIFRIYAAGFIHKNKQLASTGPYALVRHPLYLGNFLILIGFALAANNLYVWIGVALFFMIWYPAAIAYEDSKLESIFEDEWRAWSKDIRAIIPGKFKRTDLKAEGWDTYQSLIRNGELPISLYLGSCGIWLWVVTQQT